MTAISPRVFRPAQAVSRATALALPAPPRGSVVLAILAVALQLTVSANLLFLMGIHYDIPGGDPIGKIHPATYCAVLAVLIRICETGNPFGSLMRLLETERLLALFLVMMTICVIYSLLSVGITGTAVYIDSYLSAGILLLVLADASAAEKRVLSKIMLALILLNVAIAVGETLAQRHLVPFYIGDTAQKERLANFRGVALYDHPLTGAMMTSMGLFLMLQMRLRIFWTVALAALLIVGLFAFGGRTSLIVTLVALIVLGVWSLLDDLVQRRLKPGKLLGMVAALVFGLLLVWIIVTQTDIGVRIANRFYFDNSAKARLIEWQLPGLMNLHELLFGVKIDKLPVLVYQLGLVFPYSDIENFWLLSFINLGAVGFVFYLVGFFSFMIYLWRRAPLYGRAMLIVTIVIASTSDSLGRKSNILFVLAAAMTAAASYRDRGPPIPPTRRHARQSRAQPEKNQADPAETVNTAAAGFVRSLRPFPPSSNR